MIYDVTRELTATPPYPGDEPPALTRTARMEDGAECTLSRLETCLHAATHIDAPLHYILGGKDIVSLAPEVFYGECVVLRAPNAAMDASDFMRAPFAPRLLLRGRAELTLSAVEYLLEAGVVLLGTDQPGFGMLGNEAEAHTPLLKRGIALLENIDLSGVRDGRYLLSAAPLRIEGAEGAPCRALLIDL